MAAADESFAGAGQELGLELWRIENMVPVKQPEVRTLVVNWIFARINHSSSQVTGKFYSGDSYILLSTAKAKQYVLLFWPTWSIG